MRVTPYLNFNGRCEEAFKFYERALGAKVTTLMRYEGSPMAQQMPADWRNKVMHARLEVGGQILMGSDPPPDYYQAPSGFSVSLDTNSPAEADRIFAALADQGTTRMPIQETFWAQRFGMLVDRFGTPWMVNCEKTA